MPAKGATCRPNCNRRVTPRRRRPRTSAGSRSGERRPVLPRPRAARACGRCRTSRCAPRSGELLAVVGPSGCGKSTLLELLCGLQRPDSRLARRAAPAVLMPQRDLLLPWLNALDNAALALRIAGLSRAQARARAPRRCSPSSGSTASSTPDRTSCRAACASAWRSCARCSSGKPVLCLDEPFGALDAITRCEMQEWLRRVRSRASRARSCSSPTTSRRRSCSPTAWSCSRRARARGRRARASTLARPRARTDPERDRPARASAGRAREGRAPMRRHRADAWRWSALPALLLAVRAARRVGGVCGSRRGRGASCCPRRTPSRARCGATRGLVWQQLHGHRRAGRARPRARARRRPRAGGRDPPLAAAAPRRVPARGRLAGRARSR